MSPGPSWRCRLPRLHPEMPDHKRRAWLTTSRAALDLGTRCKVYKTNGKLTLSSLVKIYFILFALATSA